MTIRLFFQTSVVSAMLAAVSPMTLGEETAGIVHWRVEPLLRVQESYIDNVGLTERNEKSDFVTEVTPGFSLSGGSRKVQADVRYQAQNLLYRHDSSLNDLNHSLQASATGTFWDERLRIVTGAAYTQQLVSLDGPDAFENYTETGNKTDSKSIRFAPRWVQPVAGLAALDLGLIFNRIDDGEVATRRGYQTGLSSLPGTGPLGWRLDYSDEETDNETADRETRQRVNLDLHYALGIRYGLVASVGREENEISQSPLAPDLDGSTWSFGGQWRPSPRTDLEVRFGERAFGDMYFLQGSHHHRRWRFYTSYQEEITSNSREFLTNLEADPTDPFGGVLDSPTEVAQGNVFVQERLEFGIEYRGARTDSLLSFYDDYRDSQSGFADQDQQNVQWRVTRRLSRKNTLELSMGFERRESRGFLIASELRQSTAEMIFRRQLGRSVALTARAARVSRNGSGGILDYQAHLIGVGIELVI